jgi:hypothetical protein
VTGGSGGGMDSGRGGAGGGVDLGAGGTPGIDATSDKPGGTGGMGGLDGGGAPGADASDAPVDQANGGGIDGGLGVDMNRGEAGLAGACITPLKAWSYVPSPSTRISWDNDGSLVTGHTFYPTNTQYGPTPGGTPKTITGNGSADILVAKLDANTGNPTWVFTAGDDKDQMITAVGATSAGVGVVGTFSGSLEIVTGTPIVNSGTNAVDFIAGLKDSDGTGVWSKKVNLGGGKLATIATHPAKDYFLVCGSAMNAAVNLSAVGTPGGGKDVVVAAVKVSDGSILWSKLFGGALDQECTAAAIDDDGNAILAGMYAGTLDFGLGDLSPAPTGAQDGILWVAKLNGATGAAMAAKSYGTAGRVWPTDVAVDAQGNVVVGGYFSSTSVTFGATVLTRLSTGSSVDALVAKLDSSLGPVWVRRWGGTTGTATIRGVGMDSTGKVTVAGVLSGTADVGPGSEVLTSSVNTVASTSNRDSLIATLNGTTGATLCAQAYGDGSSNGGFGNAVAINRWETGTNKDSVAIIGGFTGVVNFGAPTTPLNFTSSLTNATYLLRM